MWPSLRTIGGEPTRQVQIGRAELRPSRGTADRSGGAVRSWPGTSVMATMWATLTMSVDVAGFDVAEHLGLPRPVAEPIAAFRAIHADDAVDALAVREQQRDVAREWPRRSRRCGAPRGPGHSDEEHVRAVVEHRAGCPRRRLISKGKKPASELRSSAIRSGPS